MGNRRVPAGLIGVFDAVGLAGIAWFSWEGKESLETARTGNPGAVVAGAVRRCSR